eukprot:scaffold328_cov130-Cylindrotheca_fusiformis.AAC.34
MFSSRIIGSRMLRQSTFLATTTSVALAGGAATYKVNCESSIQTNSSGSSLFVPTLEAGTRALRLVQTAGVVVLDYEMAKLKRHFDGGKQEIELTQLEDKMADMEQELEQAQREYASQPEKDSGMSWEQRIELKQEQKKRMHAAAMGLAEAEEALKSMEGGSARSRLHRRSAKRLLELCRKNGGVYIKVGQHLANLDYLIPHEYIEVLSSLFDEAPQSDYSQVCHVIEEELGGTVDELFDNFNPVPIASASLAQVHVAYDKPTGRKLAVKVQHYGLRETSSGDIFAVTMVVRLVDRLFSDFTFGWIADEIAPHLPKELDFTREGKNSERAAEHLKGSGLDCIVPKVIWKRTAPRVLTMEFEEGFKSTDVDALEQSGLNKHFVHCDPHPGNILLRSKNGRPQMVLIDHGLYNEIDNSFRVKYAELWKSLMLADLKGIERSCQSLGIGKAYPLFTAMLTARPYDEIIERSKTGSFSAGTAIPDSQADKAVIRGYAKHFLSEIFALLGVLPRQVLLLLKMNDCLRHIDFALGSPTNTLVVAGKYASRAVYLDQMEARASMGSRFNICEASNIALVTRNTTGGSGISSSYVFVHFIA